jgi:uncharacterized protein YkwD
MHHLRRLVLPLALSVLLPACGDGTRSARPSSAPAGASDKAKDGDTETRVVIEKLPDGSIKKTTIRTTKKVVEAPPPPPRPEDPYPSDPLIRYNVEQINRYRATKGLGKVLYDAKISAFAKKGSERLSRDHQAHAHFAANVQGAPGFGSKSAENQGDPAGVPELDADGTKNGKKQIDIMLKLMMDEGPGGGHYDNMMNPRFRRVGIGLHYAGGRLYMTNDFSD